MQQACNLRTNCDLSNPWTTEAEGNDATGTLQTLSPPAHGSSASFSPWRRSTATPTPINETALLAARDLIGGRLFRKSVAQFRRAVLKGCTALVVAPP